MPRRAHRKSRNGCIECKRRHMKCDEKRPICSNCTSSERKCEYAPVEIVSRSGNSLRADRTPSRSVSTSSAQPSPAPPQASDQDGGQVGDSICPPVNMHHVELFYHLSTQTIHSFGSDLDSLDISFADIMKELVSAPYLMNQLLALAAMHLSTLSADKQKQDFHRRQATELQTHALSIFNAMNPEINAQTCVPVFVFSSILGLHVMCETFIYRESTFDAFLDRFIRYLGLHQGVKTITQGTWHLLSASPLSPLLKQGEASISHNAAPGITCSRLSQLLETADLSQESITNCQQAIFVLQSVLSAAQAHPTGKPDINAIITWPLMLGPRYTELLRRREPHALVILAHYAALVHTRSDVWVCGDGGRFVVELITEYLGQSWSDWMEWPNRVVLDPRGAIAAG